MHSSAIHDAYAGATPSQRDEAKARRARHSKIRARACEDTPIACLSASSRSAGVRTLAVAESEPIITEQDWVERQRRNYKPWFSIDVDFPDRKIRVEDIQRATAKRYGITRAALVSERRVKELVTPRFVAMFLCKTIANKSLPEIGRGFGGRDHTSALHAVRRAAEMIASDPIVAGDVAAIKSVLGV
jgi:hypothetical protein